MHNVSDRPRLDLAGVDWAQAWKTRNQLREKPGDAAHWSARSTTYGAASQGDYEREFLRLAGIRPGETVLDFGCGIGLLAVPLAQMGCRVVACDFSAGMLEQLDRNARAAGVSDRIDARLVSWDDDWEAAGLGADAFDVAIASRSMSTPDLLASLRKLDAAARRRVCVTVAAGRSPRRDERAFEAVGRPRTWVADYAYCMGVLFQHGVFPELSYVVTRSRPAFADRATAFAELAAMVTGESGAAGMPGASFGAPAALTAREAADLEAFLDAHYALDPDAQPTRAYASDELREVRWAFIAWGAADGNAREA